MIYHIKRFKPSSVCGHYRTIIEESDDFRGHGEIRPVYGWVEPHKVVGYEIYLRDNDVASALAKACALFEEYAETKYWRDELGRVSL